MTTAGESNENGLYAVKMISYQVVFLLKAQPHDDRNN